MVESKKKIFPDQPGCLLQWLPLQVRGKQWKPPEFSKAFEGSSCAAFVSLSVGSTWRWPGVRQRWGWRSAVGKMVIIRFVALEYLFGITCHISVGETGKRE